MHGINAADPAGQLRRDAHSLVENGLRFVAHAGARNQATHDAWHSEICDELQSHFADGGYGNFTVGQAQKWINMSLKYALTLAAIGWLDVPDAPQVRRVAHAPIDAFFLRGLPELPQNLRQAVETWSRIRDYSKYMAVQQWLRETFAADPLDVEFHVWRRISEQRRSPSVGITER